MGDRGYDELMRKAVSASDDTTEVRDEEGRVARITRDESYPGAVCVRLDATEDQTRYPTEWILPATESRPSFYPDDVPFVSGLSCLAKQASRRLFAIWDDENGTDPELRRQLAASVPPALRDAVDAVKARRDAGEPLGEVGLKELTECLGDDSVREWAAPFLKESEPDERFVTGFESIVNDCLEAGWREEDVSEDLPFPHLTLRLVALRRAGLQRVLVLSGARGPFALLLTQQPAETPDSA